MTAKNTAVDSPRRSGVISVRTLSITLSIVSILAMLFAIAQTNREQQYTQSLYRVEQERQACDKAIQQLMDGSDFLTNQVRQFTVKGERAYMDAYWTEIHETRSREKALDIILSADITPEERAAALAGKNGSDELIDGEAWAMRMVCDSIGIAASEMPEEVANVTLSAADAGRTPSEKQSAALTYVFSPEYYNAKSAIRESVNTFRSELTERYAQEALEILGKTKLTFTHMSVALVVFLGAMIVVITAFMAKVVTPLVDFSDALSREKSGDPLFLREKGALEIRQFAGAFNALSSRMQQNIRRLQRLGYIDYLTDVPNRASITEYVGDMIEKRRSPLGLMIVDIDNFKKFNDTYGHAVGDRVLRSVAQAISAAQPQAPGIAGRLCGEEFIVALPNADERALAAVAQAILENVRAVTYADVGLPETPGFGITVSAGGTVWRGRMPASFEQLLAAADQALYVSKRTGKNRYTDRGGAGAEGAV